MASMIRQPAADADHGTDAERYARDGVHLHMRIRRCLVTQSNCYLVMTTQHTPSARASVSSDQKRSTQLVSQARPN